MDYKLMVKVFLWQTDIGISEPDCNKKPPQQVKWHIVGKSRSRITLSANSETKMQNIQLTVATPCTWAVVPSGNVIIGLFGSTWMMETVPSGLLIVWSTAGVYWVETWKNSSKNNSKFHIRETISLISIFGHRTATPSNLREIWEKF